MLQFRDSRDGSIELTGAHPSGLAQLLAGRATRLSSLIRDQELLSDARRRARSIRQKAEQLAGERGISTAHLAIGFATWNREERGVRTEYAAPVMLRHVRLVPRGSRVEDFEIVLDDEITINPALVDYLKRVHDVRIDADEWVDSTGVNHGFDPAPVFERLRALAKGVPGLLVNQRLVVSTFANIIAPFTLEELPADHPILRALAGDPEARRRFGGPGTSAPASEPGSPIDSADPTETAGQPRDAQTAVEPESEGSDGGGGELEEPTEGPDSTDQTSDPRSDSSDQASDRRSDYTDQASDLRSDGSDQTPDAQPDRSADPESDRTADDQADDAGTAAEGRADLDEPDEDVPEPGAPREQPRPLPDRKPQEEFLAIDVDGDQQAVVDAAVTGESLVVDTPPGTGATQVAVAIATTLAHTGRSVLYIAQSADGLDDFEQRLAHAGLKDFAIDGRMTAAQIHRRLISLIAAAERAQKPELADLLAKLNEQRAVLAEHSESLHRIRRPWGVSVFSTMQHLARLTADQPGPATPVRFGSDVVEAIPEARAALRERLIEFSALGAFTLGVEDTVWFGARFASNEDAEAARQVAERAGRKIPGFVELVEPLLRQAGLNPERTINAWGSSLRVLLAVRKTLDKFSPDVYDHNLTELIAATGTADYRREHGIEMGLFERNRLKKAAREFLRPGSSVEDLHTSLLQAQQERRELREIAGRDIRPQIPRGLLEADELCQEIEADFRTLEPVLADTPDGGELGAMLVEEAQARLDALGSDRESLADLPERTRVEAELLQWGVGELLDDLRERRVPHELVGQEFDLAYWATVLQLLASEDTRIGEHDGAELHRVAADFRICDKQYVAAGASRLQWSHAQGWKRAITELSQEAQAVRAELRSRHLHVNRLSESAPTVLGSLAPIWMMSPFQVPEHFSGAPLFDAVIIADAARLSVPEVLPAIARARQVIALGDERLLGPREFSVAVDRRSQRELDSVPSAFSALAEFLPTHRLHVSYRVSPAGLVDLANRHFYDSAITSVPTALTNEGSGLELSFVPDALGTPDSGTGQVESLDVEVQRVVDLVLKHARTRARQSLAVVTLTPWHAQRVATAIQKAIRDYPYVASFFTDSGKEPFVVTDCERIQGTVRDAVIMSLGYGRTRHGRIVYNFGSLSKPGGERLLAAAITRARRKLTIVSCFEADDFDTSRLRHGARVLPGLLADAAAGGRALLPAGSGEREPLISDIAERLLRSGVTAWERYGDIDLAIPVSAEPAQGMALAVETDGQAYASTPSIRERERLRPEALTRRGWRFLRVWSTDAFVDPQSEADRIFDVWKETVEDLSPQAVLDAARAAAVVVGRQGNRPKLTPGLPLHKYSESDIDAMVDWIQSDRVSRSDSELREQLRTALAQKSQTRRVESGLNAAVDRYRARYAEAKRQASSPDPVTPAEGNARVRTSEQPDLGSRAGHGSRVARASQAGHASHPEPVARTEHEVFLPVSSETAGQGDVMPLYDTGQLRDQDLLDADLRAAGGEQSPDESGAREAGGSPADGDTGTGGSTVVNGSAVAEGSHDSADEQSPVERSDADRRR